MKKITLIVFCFAITLTAHVNALTPTEELAGILKTYETVQGKFTQTLVDAKGELLQESSGVFSVKSPGFFHWETLQPFPQLLVSDLKTIWLYDPDLEQVTVTPYSDNVDRSPALLLSGNAEQITTNYTVEKSKSVSDVYILIPKFSPSNFTELSLTFVNKTIVSMQLKDSLEQTTTFNFLDPSVNQSVDSTLFSFEPPPGVDILKNE